MKSKELFRLNIGLQSLAIFRNLLKDPEEACQKS